MIYITGATGHIGNNLVRELYNKNYNFKILARKITSAIKEFENFTIIGNIFSSTFLHKHIKPGDTLIHLAAYINLKNTEIKLTEDINYIGTKIIADFCKENYVYLVFSSSVDAIYSPNDLITEPNNIDISKLKNIYQISKAKATNYIFKLSKQSDLKSLIIYPSAVIGINDYKPSPIGKEIKRCFNKKICLYFKGGYNFIDVLDVVLAIIKAIDKKQTGSVIVSGYYLSLFKLYKLIFKSINKNPLMIKIPLFLIKFTSKILPKYKVMIEALLSKHNYSNKKMQNELKIKLTPIQETIIDTVNWFKYNE
ncbi:MAG: NAD-dependent epimerase/dehydratase family protein [Bacillota bacterium]